MGSRKPVISTWPSRRRPKEEERAYVYKQMNSKKVEDIEKYANEQTGLGWELFQVLTAQDRYVSIFRKPKV